MSKPKPYDVAMGDLDAWRQHYARVNALTLVERSVMLKTIRDLVSRLAQAERERDEERAHADRLAKELRELREATSGHWIGHLADARRRKGK